MKKYMLTFSALIFTGSFDDTDNAFNTFMPGSGSACALTETEKEGSKTVTFTDHTGATVTAAINDGICGVVDANAAPVGFALVPAAIASTWQDATA